MYRQPTLGVLPDLSKNLVDAQAGRIDVCAATAWKVVTVQGRRVAQDLI